MLEDAFAGFKAEVQAVVIGIALLQHIDHAQALQVVLKAAVRGHAGVERVLPGVAKRGVAQIVREGDGFRQVFFQIQRAGDGAGQLRHFQAVREARAEHVAFVVHEHLRFVNQPPEGRGVNDAVAVALELAARGRGRLRVAPAAREAGAAGPGGER